MFVQELARLLESHSLATALKYVVMKAVMVMPVWLFQKPHPKSKDKDHIPRLEDKLSKWHEGDVVSSSMKVRPS